MTHPFADHFAARSDRYAQARPEYPEGLFDWLGETAPARGQVWEAGCGSGQASRALARVFAHVRATDASVAQIAQATGPSNIDFSVAPAGHSGLPDASCDAVCVAQALHWFDREAFFAEASRVLKPGGVLVAWGYQDVEVPAAIASENARLQAVIRDFWPPERADVDAAYAGYTWPFPRIQTPALEMAADWPLQRLLGYYASYSASQRHAASTGRDIVAESTPAFIEAWRDQGPVQVRWPLFIHAFRKPN